MKKIVAIGLVLFGLLLSAFYVMGVLTERSLKQNISSLNDNDKYKVKIINYKRGFFSSKAIVNLEIITPAKVKEVNGKRLFQPANTYFTSLPLQIYHGPIIFSGPLPKFGLGYAASHITIPSNYIKNFANKYTAASTKPELDLNVFVSFTAHTSINILSSKFNLISSRKKSDFEWLGMTGHIEVTRDLNDIIGNVSVKGLTWMQDKVTTVLKEVSSYFKLYKGDFDLYLGDSGVHIPAALVSQDKQKLIELNNLDFKSNSFVDKDLFNSSLQASLDKLYVNKQLYQNCFLDLYVRNLDAKKLIDVNNKIKRAQNGTDGQRRQLILSLLPDLPELFNKGAEIEISDFNVDIRDGNVKGRVILSLANENNKNPFYLIQKARGSGHLQITKSLLSSFLRDIYANSAKNTKQINQDSNLSDDNKDSLENSNSLDLASINSKNKIDDLIKRGALLEDGDNYVVDLKLIQGRLIVNDKPFSMDMLRL